VCVRVCVCVCVCVRVCLCACVFMCVLTVYVGLAQTIYIRCVYGVFGRDVIKYTVIYGVDVRIWPTLCIWHAQMHACLSGDSLCGHACLNCIYENPMLTLHARLTEKPATMTEGGQRGTVTSEA